MNSLLLGETNKPERITARNNLLEFCKYVDRDYEAAAHLVLLSSYLAQVEHYVQTKGRGGVGRLIVNLPPRHGKPISVDALVLTASGARKRLGDIDLNDQVITHTGRAQHVLAIHEQGQLEALRITTESGRVVDAATDHPFLTPDGWIEAKELQIGDTLATVVSQSEGKSSQSLEAFRLAGYFVGDGNVTGTIKRNTFNAQITVVDDKKALDIIHCAQTLGFAVNSNKRKDGLLLSGGVRDWLKEIGLAYQSSHTKRAPEFVFNGNRQQIANFIGAYFSCDGSLNQREKTRNDLALEFYSINYDLLGDIQHLLLRLGIRSRLRIKRSSHNALTGKPHLSWRLAITSQDDATKFRECVPVFGVKALKLSQWRTQRSEFDRVLLPDQIKSIMPIGQVQCRCLTVENDHSFLANDIAVHNSQTISKRWPAYLLGRHPDWHLGLVAYGDELAADFSRANRYLCDASPEYHELFPNIRLHPASGAVHRWALDSADQDNPSVVATGIGGVLTGRGFQIIVIDDPIKNRLEADSQTYREHLKDSYKSTIRTRLEPGGAIIIVCTRWHEDDLPGWLLELQRQGKGERWVVINLPAIAETNDLLGRQPGEALWAARFDVDNLLATQAGIDDYEWQAQFMGRPVSPKGAVFKREWWREETRFDITDMQLVQTCVGRWISFDTAMKDEEDNAYTSCTVGELWPDYRMATREVWRERLEFPELPATIEAIARRYNADGKLRGVIIEDKASGTSAYQTLMASSKKWLKRLLIAFQPSGDKTQRARQASVWCRNGCVLLPWPNAQAPWLADFEDELFSFPTSAFKDQVDSFSQLIIYTEKLLEEGWQARGGE